MSALIIGLNTTIAKGKDLMSSLAMTPNTQVDSIHDGSSTTDYTQPLNTIRPRLAPISDNFCIRCPCYRAAFSLRRPYSPFQALITIPG